MHEKFAEGWRAAAYVGGGLQQDYRDGSFEVVLQKRGELIKKLCSSRDLPKVLQQLTIGFPMATVYYHEDSAAGFLAQIRCHCSHEKGKACCKHGDQHRAKVFVVRSLDRHPARVEDDTAPLPPLDSVPSGR